MPTLDSPEMMRAIIMDHYEYPRNKKLKNLDGALKVHMDSDNIFIINVRSSMGKQPIMIANCLNIFIILN